MILPLPLTAETAPAARFAATPIEDSGLMPFLPESSFAEAGTDVSERGLDPPSVRPGRVAVIPNEGLGDAMGREGLAPIACLGVTEGRDAGRAIFLAAGRPPSCEPATGRLVDRVDPMGLEGVSDLR